MRNRSAKLLVSLLLVISVDEVLAQDTRADPIARANSIVRTAPLSLGQEFQKAVLFGDFATANALREAAVAAGLAGDLGDPTGDDGRAARSFQALAQDDQAVLLQVLRILESGEGLEALDAVADVEAGFPDQPQSLRRIVAATRRFRGAMSGERTAARLVGILQAVNQDADMLRNAGFFRLHASMLAAATAAAKELAARYGSEQAQAEAQVARAVAAESAAAASEAPAAPLQLRGMQSAPVVELRPTGDAPHEVIGDYVVGEGKTLRALPGARVRFAPGAKIVVNDGGSIVVKGSAANPRGWVTFFPGARNANYTGIRLENGGAADLTGWLIEGALCALSTRGGKPVTMKDCVVRSCGAPREAADRPAIAFDACRDNVVQNCLIEGSRGPAMTFSHTTTQLVECTIRGGQEDAIRGNYFAMVTLTKTRIEDHVGHALAIDDRSKIVATDCVFLNKSKAYEVFLTDSPDASTFEACWWGSSSVRAAREIYDGKASNLPRLHDGRDVKDGSTAVSIITGKPVEKNPGDAIGCRGLQLPR